MEEFDFNESTIRLCQQGESDHLADFNIFGADLDEIRTPLNPRSMYATPVDYERY